MKPGVLICCTVVLTAGCRSASAPGSSPGTVQPLPSTATPIPENASKVWHLQPATTSLRYRITSTAILELSGVRDSIASTTVLTLNTQPVDSAIIFSGTVDSAAANAGSQIGPTEGLPKFPIAFAGTVSPKGIRVTAPSDCAPAALAPGSFVPRLALTFPTLNLTTGYSWSDSITFSSCSSDIPVSTTVIRSFRVVGEEINRGSQTIIISRTDRLRAEGAGSQGQHRVELSSSGTGLAQLWVTADTGRLIRSTSEFSGTVVILSSGRSQTFNQRVIERIGRANSN